MNPDNAQLLAQLADIHGAAPPGWWPLAPGWWVVAAVLALLLFFTVRALLRRAAVSRRRRRWLAALDAIGREHDPAAAPCDYLAALSRLFRAIALRAFPGTACARLQGQAWVEFIAALMPEDTDVTGLEALAEGPYQAAPAFDAAALEQLARTWVRRYG